MKRNESRSNFSLSNKYLCSLYLYMAMVENTSYLHKYLIKINNITPVYSGNITSSDKT